MRKNVDIDEEKLATIQKLDSTLKTKKEIIDLALEELISSLRRKRIREMRGMGWYDDLDEMQCYDETSPLKKDSNDVYLAALQKLESVRGSELWNDNINNIRS